MTYPFEQYEARDDDGNVVSSVNVYRVTDDHDGETVTTTGGNATIHKGDVLVQSPNPNYVDVFTGDTFDALGYASADAPSGAEPVTPVSAEDASDAATEPGSATPLDTGAEADSRPQPGTGLGEQ